MTNSLQSPTLLLASTLLFAACAVRTEEVQARNASSSETGVKISYSLPSTQLSLHEPISINFEINNESKQIVRLDLGQDRKGGFLITVTSPDGTTSHLPQYKHEGISRYGTVSVQPGETFSQRLLLNEWYDHFNSPGRYKLEARLITTIAVGNSFQLQDSGFKGEIPIAPRDAAQLKRFCEELATQVATAPNPEAAQEPARILSYVEDPVAVPYLARVLSTNTFTQQFAIEGLERVGDDAAIEVLLSSLDYVDSPGADPAARSLARMEDRISNPHLRETVKKGIESFSQRVRRDSIKTQISYLDYRDPNLQKVAIQALIEMGPDALQQAEPVLQRLTNDPNQPADVRAAAQDALKKLNPNN